MNIKQICFTLLLIVNCFGTIQAKTYGNIMIDTVISVYDGDTIRINIKDFPAIIGENIGIRLYGIDTPEIRDKNPNVKKFAFEARNFLQEKITKGKIIEIRNIQRGKYFRIIGELFIDNEDIAKLMIQKGYAVRYYGGRREKWTKILMKKMN